MSAKELKKTKTKIFESVRTEIDPDTGLLLNVTKDTVNVINSEPDYIKLYYETMLAFNQIHDIPMSFLLSMSKFLEWSNDGQPMFVTLNRRVREILENDCGCKSAQISRYIAKSVKNGLLFKTEYRGVYEVNPFMIAKGKWQSIRKLQCNFDYMEGKWVRQIVENAEEGGGE